jgi:BNR repeat-like domain
VRRLLPALLFLVLASTATAATIQGSKRAELIVGTQAADRVRAGGGPDRVQVAFGGVDSVDCGAGIDIVSADASDRVASNCEIVSRRLSVDPYANDDSQHETAVEPDSAASGSTVVAAFQLGRRENGASANIGTAVSTDAGRTWQRSYLPGTTTNATPPGPEIAASDPSVAFDAVHGVWLVSSLTIEPDFSHIYVSRSTDGASWSAPIDAAGGVLLDKEWITCDNGAASPFRGRCYLEYTDDQQNRTVSQFSTDGGVTWSAPVRAGSILVGTQPVIRPDGTLVVVAGDYRGQSALSGSMVALRSTDGGATFARFVVSDLRAAGNDPMRAIALPSVDIDANGTIYAVWHDCRFRASCALNDMVLSTSADGLTWSPPTRIPLAPASSTESFFIPGLAADPLHPGRLGLVYAYFHAGSCSKGACLLGIGFAQSRDAGRTWSTQQLDAQPFSTNWVSRADGGRMVGDYFSVSFAGDRVVPVFPLATTPVKTRFRQGIFAASLRALG